MEENVVGENEEYKAILLHGFDYKLFQEEEGGGGVGVIKGLYEYQYLKHLIELWTGGWV